MKHLPLWTLGLTILLAACSTLPAAPAAQGTQTPRSLSSSLITNTSEPADAGAIQTENIPQVALAWDTSPGSLIISATNCCGLVPPDVSQNYIPAAQVWGDGRIVWTTQTPKGGRQVLEGQLSQDQLAQWLQSAQQDGFFGWKALYTEPLAPADLPPKCITIHLSDQSHQVCEYYQGAPQAFHTLYDQLANGLGTSGRAFKPQRGYLVASAVPGDSSLTADQSLPAWDAAANGLDLSQATGGKWIEGPALQAAWELVNRSLTSTGVMQNGKLYRLVLQIPDLSQTPPPAQ